MEIEVFWREPNMSKLLNRPNIWVLRPYIGVSEDSRIIVDKITLAIGEDGEEEGFWHVIAFLSREEAVQLRDALNAILEVEAVKEQVVYKILKKESQGEAE